MQRMLCKPSSRVTSVAGCPTDSERSATSQSATPNVATDFQVTRLGL